MRRLVIVLACCQVSRCFVAPSGEPRCLVRRRASEEDYRSGFVGVVGSPNVGKSTLVNTFLGQKLCIATSKAQTTRHSILGLASGDGYQMALTDTPGVLHEPAYALQRSMVGAARRTCRDAEVVLLVTDIFETAEGGASQMRQWLGKTDCPLVVAVNKVDLFEGDALGPVAKDLVGSEAQALERAERAFPDAKAIVPISALKGDGIDDLKSMLVKLLPVSPPVFPPEGGEDDDEPLTNRPSRFFAAEIIREQLLEQYSKEIPYSCEVRIDQFDENLLPDVLEIHATILCARDSQKAILIGAKGQAIKQTGIKARENLQDFFQVQKVRLNLRVKTRKNWRSDDTALRQFGYIE